MYNNSKTRHQAEINSFCISHIKVMAFFARLLRSGSSLGFFAFFARLLRFLPRYCRVIAAPDSRGFRGGFEGVSLRERRKGEDRAKKGRSQPLTHSKGLAVISGKMV